MLDAGPPAVESATNSLAALPFVGRDAELSALVDALDRALAGHGQSVLLIGEPGIGKTRLAERISATARDRQTGVFWGNCYEWEGAPPFWPWAQILRAWMGTQDDAGLRQVLGANASLVAQIVPDVAERLVDLPAVARLEPEARLFRLLAATSAILRNAARRQPVMIVLDDIHWADRPSLQLLHFLTQEIRDVPVLIVATYRNVEVGRDHPAAPILADLAREPNCRRLGLRGLPKPQIARFMALVAGSAQPPSLVDAVTEETAGNPFFVAEVVRLLADEGMLGRTDASESGRLRVPESVREAINRRLSGLSDACNRVLATASVIGRQFDVGSVGTVAECPTFEVLGAVDEATRAHLLVPTDLPGTFCFGHALVQEGLYQEMPAAERARLHLKVAETLEAKTSDREPPWEELAHHYYQAMPLGHFSRIADCAERAGDAAVTRLAWDSATTQFRRALEALDAGRSTDDARRCELLLALGEAQNRAGSGSGDVPAARDNLWRAFVLARALGHPEGMARAAVAHVGLNIVGAFGGVQQVEMLEESLSALGPGDHPLRVQVLGRLAVDLHNRSNGRSHRAQVLSDDAVAIADPAQRAFALWAHMCARSGPDDLRQRAQDAVGLIAMADQAGDPLFGAWGHLYRLTCFLEVGNLAGAEREMASFAGFGERAHIPYLAQRAAAFHGMIDLVLGRYADAEQRIAKARDLWQSDSPRQHQCQEFVLLRELGRLEELAEDITVPNELHVWRQSAQAHRMCLALDRGQVDVARLDYEGLIATDRMREATTDTWFSVVARLTEAAIAFHDGPHCSDVYDRLRPFADRIGVDGRVAVCYGPMSLYLGQLAAELAQWEDSQVHLNRSLAISERLGLRPFVARSLLALAQLHAKRHRPGDRRTARKLAQRALDEAAAIGMRGLEPSCRDLLASLAPCHDARFGLTARELEVLHLVADGLTDAAIAQRLALSPRTVNSHLTSIYTKLDVSSRRGAAQAADEFGLV
jgi:DNA-binding CsgD family transcriptional regulator